MALLKKFFKSLRKIFKKAQKGIRSGNRRREASVYRLRRVAPLRRKKIRSVNRPSSRKGRSGKKGIGGRRRNLARFSRPKPSSVRIRPSQARPRLRGVPVSAAPVKKEPQGVLIGEITHFFNKIRVGVIDLTHGPIRLNDEILIQGPQRCFRQRVKSLQIESVDVREAPRGKLVGLKVDQPVRPGDKVFRMV